MYGFLEKRLVSFSLKSKKQRLYIMPTRVGFYFSAVVFILFLISFSYGHSLAYSSSFIIISVLVISLPFTNYIISGVELRPSGSLQVFADQASRLSLQMKNKSGRYRFDLEFDLALLGEAREHRFFGRGGTLSPNESQTIDLALGEISPGHYHTLNIRLKSSFPFGLFFSWCYFSEDVDVWIYPARKHSGELAMSRFFAWDHLRREDVLEGERERKVLGEHDDFSHHSLFNPGHSFGSVDWKLFARSGTLYVKEFEGDIPQYECIELMGESISSAQALAFEVSEALKRGNPFMVRADQFSLVSEVGHGAHHAHMILQKLTIATEKLYREASV